MRIADTATSVWVLPIPKLQMFVSTSGPDNMSIRLVVVTAPWKSIARNSSPLPRKNVENNRSSTGPSWSRTTPMNHRKAMPANGTRWRPPLISARRCASSSRVRGSASRRAKRIIVSAVSRRTANTMPATAAERRLRQKRVVIGVGDGSIGTAPPKTGRWRDGRSVSPDPALGALAPVTFYAVGVSRTAMGRPQPQTEAWVRSAFALLSPRPAVRRVGLALVEGGGRRLSFTASDRDRRHTTDWCHVDAYDDVPLNNTIRTGKLITGSLEQLADRYAEFVARQERATCALAAVPVVAAGQVMGGFVLFYGSDQPFDAAQLTELERLGEELGEDLRQSQRLRTRPHRSLADEPVPDGARGAPF